MNSKTDLQTQDRSRSHRRNSFLQVRKLRRTSFPTVPTGNRQDGGFWIVDYHQMKLKSSCADVLTISNPSARLQEHWGKSKTWVAAKLKNPTIESLVEQLNNRLQTGEELHSVETGSPAHTTQPITLNVCAKAARRRGSSTPAASRTIRAAGSC